MNEHKTVALTKSLSHRIKEIVATQVIELDEEKRRLIKFCEDSWSAILPVWSKFDSIIAWRGSTDQDQKIRYVMNNHWRMQALDKKELKALADRLASYCTKELLSKPLTPCSGVLATEFQAAIAHARERLPPILKRFRGTVPFSYEEEVFSTNKSLRWLSVYLKNIVEEKSGGGNADDGLQYFLGRLFKLYPKLYEVILKNPDIPRAR